MNIELSGRHFDLSEEMKSHVTQKLEVMERFYDGIDDVHVVLEFTSGVNHAHVQLRGDRIKLDAKAQSHDMYAAFDETVSNLERQLRRFKDRAHGHPHRGQQEQAPISAGPGMAIWDPAEPSELEGPVLISDDRQLPRLTTDEAMTEYEMSGCECMPFLNTETGRVSAVYRSKDGSSQVVELTRRKR